MLPTSGVIKFSDIESEFLGTTPVSFSQYYRGAGLVPLTGFGNNANIPTGGTIQISDFYGTRRAFPFLRTLGNTFDYNFYNDAVDAGWNETLPIIGRVVISPDCYVGSTSRLSAAFHVDVLPDGSSLELVLSTGSIIVGKGGTGGTGAPSGTCGCSAGGDGTDGGFSLKLEFPVHIINDGTIGAPGGGGGGGGAECSYIWNASAGGGGGGAGFGDGGGINGCGVTLNRFGSPGKQGTAFLGGLGGSRGNDFTAFGGYGGGLGQSGKAGQTISAAGGRPGAPGQAIINVSNAIYIRQGTIIGTVV